METVVKKKSKSTLNQTQLSHALNRLQTIFTSKAAPLSATSHQRCVDWKNEEVVDAFFKKHKLAPFTNAHICHYLFGGHALPSPIQIAIDTALRKEFTDSRKNAQLNLERMNAALATAQDQLIFGKVNAEEVPNLLAEFEERLVAILSA